MAYLHKTYVFINTNFWFDIWVKLMWECISILLYIWVVFFSSVKITQIYLYFSSFSICLWYIKPGLSCILAIHGIFLFNPKMWSVYLAISCYLEIFSWKNLGICYLFTFIFIYFFFFFLCYFFYFIII